LPGKVAGFWCAEEGSSGIEGFFGHVGDFSGEDLAFIHDIFILVITVEVGVFDGFFCGFVDVVFAVVHTDHV
jgi:hypothetical protein